MAYILVVSVVGFKTKYSNGPIDINTNVSNAKGRKYIMDLPNVLQS